MHGDFPTLTDLYGDPVSLELLRNAALVEARGYGRWTRLREVVELSRLMGFRKLGLACGPDMIPVAELASESMAGRGLEPVLPPPPAWGDPLTQARFFRDTPTDLNVVTGLSVAAEALFLKASEAPAAVLIARDLRFHHNSAAALYLSRSYLQEALHGRWPASDREAFADWEAVLREEASLFGGLGEEPPPSRLEEILTLAHRMGITDIGITFCVGLRGEAETLAGILEINDFRVSSACCKTGATPKEEIGIQDEEKVRPGRPEMICNPVAQAELLNREKVQFTIMLGQCVGHDAATFRHLAAPAVCLVAKDRVLGHNPVAALTVPCHPPETGSRGREDDEAERGFRSPGAAGSALAFRPLGRVENGLPLGTPGETLRASESRIVLDPVLAPGLSALEGIDRILVVFCFHLSTDSPLLQHPRGDESRPKRGVFALRSPRRPNPIGVTEVDLLGIHGNVLIVKGLDAVDGTPILDLKPADPRPGASPSHSTA
jgi:tRNA-Thr(GGU) m(6)t(6)A37 methyltransferase TsaA